jgi:hypothetical protein
MEEKMLERNRPISRIEAIKKVLLDNTYPIIKGLSVTTVASKIVVEADKEKPEGTMEVVLHLLRENIQPTPLDIRIALQIEGIIKGGIK